MRKIKESKGAASLFVLISGLFFISFILSILMLASAKRQSQIQIGKHTQEIYNELNQDKINNVKNIVPIYTVDQLLKIGSGEEIAISEENGRKYVFSPNAYYVLNSDVELEYNGIWDISQYNIDEAGYKIKIRDTSKPETAYYYYTDKYDYPVTENGFKYENLVLHFDGTNNTGNGHSNGTTVWKDLTGNGNNGTLTNFSYNSSSGWKNNSLKFDGSDDGVSIGDSLQDLFKNGNTIELKIKFNELDARDVLIGNYDANNKDICVNYEKKVDNSLRQYISAGAMDVATNPLIASNENEYIISYVFDKVNGNLFVYIDGELKYSIDNEMIKSYNQNWTNAWIGRDTRTGATCLNGEIYSVRIYENILTEQEVKNNYETEKNRTIDYSKKTKGWDFTKVSNIVKEKERIAPIPTGYVASSVSGENTISGGLVIYQGSDAVTSTNHSNAMLNRNQYVWIPVDDINDMVMCKQNGNTGTGGATICNLEYNTTTGHITCKTHGYATSTELTDSNIDTTGLAGRIYEIIESGPDENGIYKANIKFNDNSKAEQRFLANSAYREPDIVTDDSNSSYLTIAGISTGKVSDFKKQLNNNFIEMAKSVANYGGFYIARFEVGDENSKVISKKNKKVLSEATSTGNLWYGLYNKMLNDTEKATGVNSHMIWGCQHNQLVIFLAEKSEIGHIHQSATIQFTGYDGDQDVLNNIFDLEGNCYERTMLAAYSDMRRNYGGGFWDVGYGRFYAVARCINSHPDYGNSAYTTRSILYISL